MIMLYVLIFIGSCLLLVKSADWTIKSLIKIAKILHWSEFLISFTFIALGSSLPELFVGLNSAFHKVPQLSFGNIIGANILNLTIGVAIVVFLAKGIQLESEESRRTFLYAGLFVCLPLLLILDGGFSRVDGIITLLALVLYLQKTFRQKQRFLKIIQRTKEGPRFVHGKLFLKNLGIFFSSLIIVLLCSEGIVRTANFLAVEIKLPLVSLGIFILSLGTVIPEIILGIKAIKMRHSEVAMGDFFGTVIINSGLILGLVGLISPFKLINFSPYIIGMLFSFIVAIAFALFAKSGKRISQKEAVVLLAIFLVFIIAQILAI